MLNRRNGKAIRFAFLTALGLLILLWLGLYVWSIRPRDPLEVASEQIQEGMPFDEALDIIEDPEGPFGLTSELEGTHMRLSDVNHIIIANNQRKLEIRARGGLVIEKKLESADEGLFDRLRRWLGL